MNLCDGCSRETPHITCADCLTVRAFVKQGDGLCHCSSFDRIEVRMGAAPGARGRKYIACKRCLGLVRNLN